MRILILFILISTRLWSGPLGSSNQIIIVVTNSWDDFRAKMFCFERQNNGWLLIRGGFNAVVGQKGLGWGIGKHEKKLCQGLEKKEGDLRAPAGIFSLGVVFGHTSAKHIKMQWPYLELTPTVEAVDDPKSNFYNQIIDSSNIEHKDWSSSEKMGQISLYLRGVVINHNIPVQNNYSGSQIFLHLWRDSQSGTAGCTATSFSDLDFILSWIKPKDNPMIIQFPKQMLALAIKEWELPNFRFELIF